MINIKIDKEDKRKRLLLNIGSNYYHILKKEALQLRNKLLRYKL